MALPQISVPQTIDVNENNFVAQQEQQQNPG